MSQSLRMQKKIMAYSYLFKVLGIINAEEHQRITGKLASNIRIR